MEEALGALRCLDREIRARPASPTKSESPVRTSQGSSPRERSITAKQQCSGRWPGVWIVRIATCPSVDLRPVGERCGGERNAGGLVHVHGQRVLECEAAVTRDVVGVRMGLEDADEVDAVLRGRIQIRLDRVCRVDDDGDRPPVRRRPGTRHTRDRRRRTV